MENREYICTVIEALLYCARQNIGIRGYREEYPTNLSYVVLGVVGDGCSNTGNFLELIKLIARHDKAITSKLNNPKKNATYLSKRVQNELINIMGQTLRCKIISEIKESGVFSIFADETKDLAKIEQVCIGLRYLNLATNNIQERTLKVKNAEGLDASSLTNIINDVIGEYSLSLENCV